MRIFFLAWTSLLLCLSVAQAEPPADEAPSRPAASARLVQIETRFLRMRTDTARRLLGRCAPVRVGQVALLNDVGRERLLAAVERGGVVLVTSPRVTLFDRQRGNMSALNQISYLKEYEVKGEGDTQTASPVIDIVQDGVVVDVRPFAGAHGGAVTLDLTVTTSTLQRPMTKIPLTVAGKSVEIQVPEHTTWTARRLVRLRPGTHGLVRGDADSWVLVTARALSAAAVEGLDGADIDLVPADFEPPSLPKR